MICQPLAAICQVDGAALMKAVFGKAALHGQIDAMHTPPRCAPTPSRWMTP